MAVFVTGSTGFLGRYLVQGLLERGDDLVLLIRGENAPHAEERAREMLAWLDPALPQLVGERVAVVAGDLDRPGLGLSPQDRGAVLERCDSFLHCGASVRFDLPMERARAVNVEGTRAVLDLAAERVRRGPLARVDHVSTCYVAGERRDRVDEDELDGSTRHRNSYERTKYEAERLVRERRGELPIATLRPSIIVGESGFGRTSNFNTLYWPVKVYASGYWRTLPGRADTPLDIVPVDFVRDAILSLRATPESVGRCFHVAAGPEGAIPIGAIVSRVEALFPERRGVRIVDPSWWMRTVHPALRAVSFGALRRFLTTLEAYVPYFLGNPIFDDSGARALLDPVGVRAPSVSSYFERLLHYCIETDWGRRAPPEPPAGTHTGQAPSASSDATMSTA